MSPLVAGWRVCVRFNVRRMEPVKPTSSVSSGHAGVSEWERRSGLTPFNVGPDAERDQKWHREEGDQPSRLITSLPHSEAWVALGVVDSDALTGSYSTIRVVCDAQV
ncbi:hypothetical protein V6V47_30275 [Micromonospora sp. CPCC 205539]|uniref:hypothetical protein n=1 Tax=Micromonospora sp. CPCC 205539 TaxID=3122408 RepID=UPI002FF068DD